MVMKKQKRFIVHYGGFQSMTVEERSASDYEPHLEKEFPDLQKALAFFNSLETAAIWYHSGVHCVRIAVKEFINSEIVYYLHKSYVATNLNVEMIPAPHNWENLSGEERWKHIQYEMKTGLINDITADLRSGDETTLEQ